MKTLFRDLSVNQTFDWINDRKPGYNSFFKRCRKISARKYESVSDGVSYTVGSINAQVFHVNETSP